MFTPGSRLLATILTLCLIISASLWFAQESSEAQQAAAAGLAQQSYVGSNQCFTCHRRQVEAWDRTKHVQALNVVPENYRDDPACLKCHVTAFGKPDGLVLGTEKDLLHVGCESCHGPGALHLSAAQRFILAMPGEEAQAEKDLRESIVKTPGDAVCAECHVTQSHQSHPAYDGQPAAAHMSEAAVALPSMLISRRGSGRAAQGAVSEYNIKTCGACHYEEYKQWQGESHAMLAALLPAIHRSDASCQSCHSEAGKVAGRITGPIDAAHAWVGASCESCHGPGLAHVRFNRPLIGRLSLTPASEQASRTSIRQTKPSATCIQCHLGERHQSHPEYTKD
jgi:hypothetical protein